MMKIDNKIYSFNMLDHLRSQRAFSEKAFGPNFRYKGIIQHIMKELIEIENEPHDLEEWIDVALLAFDGAWRSGHSPEEILSTFMAKLEKNKSREWPDWRTVSEDEAIEHIERPIEYALVRFFNDLEDGWFSVKWPDGKVTEYNFWKDAKKAILDKKYVPKWDGNNIIYCPSELRNTEA